MLREYDRMLTVDSHAREEPDQTGDCTFGDAGERTYGGVT